jgi:hypothetical protein
VISEEKDGSNLIAVASFLASSCWLSSAIMKFYQMLPVVAALGG